ncbi:glycosyltransferase family 2 protein [Lysobacter soyae]|uniref:Glycosyltransferase family 2 protein n=1 Tax=Lysobacter soyae TaxID=2764185 RepID=A0ABX8WN27_9GAMM|nr:glycosyltransferase [Lysobacter sp. CJ11]QYR53037.1 glycosyltransferase family 2 protein [Lysobacter sp. CJ11]
MSTAFDLFQTFVLVYFLALNLGYMLLNVSALLTIRNHMRKRADYGEDTPYLNVEPAISLLVPGYNEEATIRASVRSMLQLQYPEFEVLVINDGSKDGTLSALMAEFDLEPEAVIVRRVVDHKPIRAVYRSRTYANLRVVDKENGGKADALNVGINLARHELFCAVDADSILQRDSLLRVVQPFVDDPRTVAAGGTVRIANGSQVRGGFLMRAGLPKSLLARLQIVEYLRAFLFGRLGWSPLNGVLIISGAFGVFDRRKVEAVGGYRTDTVGEDMELVVRLHQWHRRRRLPYRITYVPDPICWTECPEDLRTLGRQRSRWQRGLSESLTMHAPWRFGLRGGAAAWLAWPFMALFEWLGPLIELIGYLGMAIGFLLGEINPFAFVLFLLVSLGLGILLSVNALLLETLSFRVYQRNRDLLALFAMAVVENFGYRQLTLFWRCRGLWQWASGRQHQWGVMKRSGSWSEN